jgi:hypothetical protein
MKPFDVVPGHTKEYGRYLAVIGGCQDCHNSAFSGGPNAIVPPDVPDPANLTASGNSAKWSDAELIHFLGSGIRPDGSEANPFMPRVYGTMQDDDLAALLLFLRSLPAKETGQQ